MSAYENLSVSYDRLTSDVDYTATMDFLCQILAREHVSPESVLDLACGTGSLTLLLSQKGYRVIGADASEEMLSVAYDKSLALSENRPLFICQKMQKLSLAEPVDWVTCNLDSLNYLTNPVDCKATIKHVLRALKPGGIFTFDINTPHRLRSLDDQVFLDEDENVYCVWRASFQEKENTLDYAMDLFTRDGAVWIRSVEEHREYAYSVAQLTDYLYKAGFDSVKIYGNQTLDPPSEDEIRIYFSARKKPEASCR